jgi:MFS family permease
MPRAGFLALRRARPLWLQRNLVCLFAGRGMRSFSLGYINVIFAVYLAKEGYSAAQLGILFTAGAVISAVLTAAVGMLADRWGRKPFLIIFPVFTALASVVYGLTTSFFLVLAASGISGIGRGGGAGGGGGGGAYFPAEQALITEQCDPRNRTTVFATLSFIGTLAAASGGLVALVPDLLMRDFGLGVAAAYRPLFWLTAILGLATALVVLPVDERHRPAAAGSRRSWFPRRSAGLVVKLSITNAFNGFGFGFFSSFIAYWLYRRYGASTGEIGVLFTVVNLSSATPYLLSSRLSRSLGAVRTILITRLFAVLTLALWPLMPTFLFASLFYVLRMTFNGLAMPVRQSYVMGIAPPEERSGVAGLTAIATMAPSSVSPSLSGYIMQNVSLNLPFECSAACQLVSAVLYYFFFRRILPPEEEERARSLFAAASVRAAGSPGVEPEVRVAYDPAAQQRTSL